MEQNDVIIYSIKGDETKQIWWMQCM